ncbi:uncharacterized protein BCR38DRAFT_458798 [Pseudomassariella vexata]|uniref:Nucleolar protein 12 n=1 Tax=Pseudomassariella vexata TaxID=1141098 RepID=A0A1Y2DSU3_9PEZI|nr:uncharacterized protein BCR38DRAFT_458798 [Pseudomassariella vexata]ORY62224.1 hypothetical protein BCR38DRAFT_458798 [Pseudomassariella vexata]
MAKSKFTLAAATSVVKPELDALFSSSVAPKKPETQRYIALLPPKERKPIKHKEFEPISDEDGDVDEEDDEVLSVLEEDEQSSDEEDGSEESESASESEEVDAPLDEEMTVEDSADQKKKERKRKRRDEHDDLESKYLRKLADDDEEDKPLGKRQKGETGEAVNGESASADDSDEEETTIVHESLRKTEEHPDIELDKANRTLFLGNVCSDAISSSKAKKQLMAHLSSPLSDLDAATGPHKIESLRFRSTAFAAGGIPKRAAYITKSIMTATTKSTNAYVVYTTPLAARTALKALNGTVVLDRHLRVDSVAHPQPIAHRRCVFVGNLGFVDDETVINTTAEGDTTTKKRNKVPADIEEGLWRTFGKEAGKVESVRVPRDPKTRVGKGFAYVQFYDVNAVESALLLNEKKFPPMLPRALRVSRAKNPRKTTLAQERTNMFKLEGLTGGAAKPKSTKYKHKATPEQQSLAGRAGRLLGRAGAARQQRELKGGQKSRHRSNDGNPATGANQTMKGEMKTPEQIVFEGRRASSKDGRPKDLKFGKVRGNKKAAMAKMKGRGAKRASEWRKKGAK